MHHRSCPKCGKEITYTTIKNRNTAEKKQKNCRSCVQKEVWQRPETREKWEIIAEIFKEKFKGENNPFYGKTHSKETTEKIQAKLDYSYAKTPEYKAKMSSITSGVNNPMYGKNVYDIWLDKHGREEAEARLSRLSLKRSENVTGDKNPMFGKPAPKGSGKGWGGWYKGWYFRSLKELSYVIYVIEKNGYTWENAEQKRLSIPYVDHLGHARTYRADFFINENLLIEVKPRALMKTAINIRKKEAAELFCAIKGYEYRMVDVKTIKRAELCELCQRGIVVLSDPKKLERVNGSRRNL